MAMPIVLKGVIHGKTITLDEETLLPDGYRVTLHLILEPGEGLRLSFGGWADMTPEEIAEFEQTMTEFYGRPFKMPGGEGGCVFSSKRTSVRPSFATSRRPRTGSSSTWAACTCLS
jgi:hypothetical protein